MVRLTARQWAHRASPVLLDRFLPRRVLKWGTIMCSSRIMTDVATHGTMFSVKTDSRSTVLLEKRPIRLTKPLREVSLTAVTYPPIMPQLMFGAGTNDLTWQMTTTNRMKRTPPSNLPAPRVRTSASIRTLLSQCVSYVKHINQ